MSEPAGIPWKAEIRPGVYRALGYYRALARSGEIAGPEHWPGLIELLDLVEEFVGTVELDQVETGR